MTTTATARNKQLVQTFIQELFTHGDLGAVDRYLHPEFVNHDAPFSRRPRTGPRGCGSQPRCSARRYLTGTARWTSSSPRVTSSSSDSPPVARTAGELMGAAQPTSKTITLAGIQIFRIDRDKIVERWGRLDEVGLLRQLGLIPG